MAPQLNINQFALPGMEEHAHAGAKFLAEGKGFHYERFPETPSGRRDSGDHVLEMYEPENGRMVRAGHLLWHGSNQSNEAPHSPFPGEIANVGTNRFSERKGVASALYKMAEDPNVYTGNDTRPLHSPFRTMAGVAWSSKVGGWDPDMDDPHDRPRHPYEERAEETAKRQPKMPDPADHPGGQTTIFDPITMHRLKR